jgi:hypothetical protein
MSEVIIQSTQSLTSKERGNLLQIYQNDDLVAKLKQAEIYHSEWQIHKTDLKRENTGFKQWCETYSLRSYTECVSFAKVWEVLKFSIENINISKLNTSMGALKVLAYSPESVQSSLIPKLLLGEKLTSSDVESAISKYIALSKVVDTSKMSRDEYLDHLITLIRESDEKYFQGRLEMAKTLREVKKYLVNRPERFDEFLKECGINSKSEYEWIMNPFEQCN